MKHYKLIMLVCFLCSCSGMTPPPEPGPPPYVKPPVEPKECEYVFCHQYPAAFYDDSGRYCCIDGPQE
jgi:hypothetical protein